MRGTLEERFWEKVAPADERGCRLWTASITSAGGYGQFNAGGKMRKAHRVAWELTNGPIPQGGGYHGVCVCHRCDVRTCVNPEHLFLGTQGDNIRDMTTKGRVSRGELSSAAKLTAAIVRECRARWAAGTVSLAGMAREYGVGNAVMLRAVHRKTWRHVL